VISKSTPPHPLSSLAGRNPSVGFLAWQAGSLMAMAHHRFGSIALCMVSCVALPVPTGRSGQPMSKQRRASANAALQHHQRPVLAHDLLSGANVERLPASTEAPPPTCVLLHGILGSGRNLLSFANRLVADFPDWQVLLVDLRCHGRSCELGIGKDDEEQTVELAAQDVIQLLNQLSIYPAMLVGHSFGGKVAMEMVRQSTPILPRPVDVWVLDTVPGDTWVKVGDHPRDTIRFCRTLAPPFESRKRLVEELTHAGFTLGGAQWMTTNLKPAAGGGGGFEWAFDLDGIAEMYASYERTDLWSMLEQQPRGLRVHFVRAEHSAFVWTDEVVERLEELGADVHLLPGSSHWVHTDNPDGLVDMMSASFNRLLRH
jgi:pimeloyl-ACP methyl ester carboxylesterase